MMSFNRDFSVYFCPDDLTIGKNRILKSTIVAGLGLIDVFNVSGMLFVKLSMPEFGTHIFRSVMCSPHLF